MFTMTQEKESTLWGNIKGAPVKTARSPVKNIHCTIYHRTATDSVRVQARPFPEEKMQGFLEAQESTAPFVKVTGVVV